MTPTTESELPAVRGSETLALFRQATDVAGVCKAIVLKASVGIQGKKYVLVEGWMAIAVAHGCCASVRSLERVPGGYRCIAEVRKMSTGAVLAEAEGFVGEDEAVWFGGSAEYYDRRSGATKTKIYPKREDFAIRAMCQTRGISRVCRTVFAHVVILMDSDLCTTPAEEVGGGEGSDYHDEPIGTPVQSLPKVEKKTEPAATTQKQADQTAPVEDANAKLDTPNAAQAEVPRDAGNITDAERQQFREGLWRKAEIHFGKNKGIKLGALDDNQIQWYAEEWQPRPYQGKFNPLDRELRAALDVYCAEENVQGRSRVTNSR